VLDFEKKEHYIALSGEVTLEGVMDVTQELLRNE
jgi:hypothetical protein